MFIVSRFERCQRHDSLGIFLRSSLFEVDYMFVRLIGAPRRGCDPPEFAANVFRKILCSLVCDVMLRLGIGMHKNGPNLKFKSGCHAPGDLPLGRLEMWRDDQYQLFTFISKLGISLRTTRPVFNRCERSVS